MMRLMKVTEQGLGEARQEAAFGIYEGRKEGCAASACDLFGVKEKLRCLAKSRKEATTPSGKRDRDKLHGGVTHHEAMLDRLDARLSRIDRLHEPTHKRRL
jgi:hypothetical protein